MVSIKMRNNQLHCCVRCSCTIHRHVLASFGCVWHRKVVQFDFSVYLNHLLPPLNAVPGARNFVIHFI